MSSKQLDSILSNLPKATALPLKEESISITKRRITKLVAVVPESVKKELRARALKEGKTEKIILLEALKACGFAIDDQLLCDQRKLR